MRLLHLQLHLRLRYVGGLPLDFLNLDVAAVVLEIFSQLNLTKTFGVDALFDRTQSLRAF